MSASLQNLVALTMVTALGQFGQPIVAGQTQRTAWGDPDLQGVYTFATTTPMERPEAVANRETYTEAELAALEAEAPESNAGRDRAGGQPPESYDRIWVAGEQGRPTRRTSLVVNPPDGRIPPFTPEAQRLQAERRAEIDSRRVSRVGADGEVVLDMVYRIWTDLAPYQRCQARSIPRTFQSYNHGVQILQTPGYVVLHYESMHDARVIPLDSRPALDGSIRQWNGSSRGHWEGDTLVVDLTNLTDKQTVFPLRRGETESLLSMENMELVERFTRVDEHTIQYEVTVNDPTTWTQPWTFVLPWKSDPQYQLPEHLYEFACHEGNYRMMEGTLTGSRILLEEVQN